MAKSLGTGRIVNILQFQQIAKFASFQAISAATRVNHPVMVVGHTRNAQSAMRYPSRNHCKLRAKPAQQSPFTSTELCSNAPRRAKGREPPMPLSNYRLPPPATKPPTRHVHLPSLSALARSASMADRLYRNQPVMNKLKENVHNRREYVDTSHKTTVFCFQKVLYCTDNVRTQ